MSAIDDARAQLRERKKPRQAESWHFPEMGDFRTFRYVLAFDATLTNCGWVLFVVDYAAVSVIAKGTIRPKTAETGYLGTWDKARSLRYEAEHLVHAWSGRACGRFELVVEAPAVAGNRTESSLIAGMLVWMAAPDCHVISATHVSAVLLGDSRISSAERKKRIRAAVIRLCPETAGRAWNEHERDALATGLTHLYDLRQEKAA